MSAMPERVFLRKENGDRGEETLLVSWLPVSGGGCVPYVPESALLAAEARAKAMEDGPLDYMSGKCDRLKEQNAALRAERDALVPLLRYFVEYVEDGMYEWEDPKAPDHACDFLDNPESGYCEFHDKWGEARAILAREET